MFRARSSTPSGILPPMTTTGGSSTQQPVLLPPSSAPTGSSTAASASSSPPRGGGAAAKNSSQRALLLLKAGAVIRSTVMAFGLACSSSRGGHRLFAAAALVGCGCFFTSSWLWRRAASFDGVDPLLIHHGYRVPPLLSRTIGEPSWLTKECRGAVDKLEKANIRLVAFDFDLTLVNVHTGGQWMGSTDELARHVRPDFACYVSHAMDRGLHVSVATFSTQKDLIARVLRIALPTDDIGGRERIIPVFGGDDYVPEFESGKQSQLVLSLQHYAEQEDATTGGRDANNIDDDKEEVVEDIAAGVITPSQTLLVDDDVRNIAVARRDGYATLHYRPDVTRLFDAEIAVTSFDSNGGGESAPA